MAKIILENPRINETVYIGGIGIRVRDGVAESDDENVLAQAKAAGYKIEGNEGAGAGNEGAGAGNEGAGAGNEGAGAGNAPSKEALIEVAKSLNIDVKGNWGVPKLTEEIAKARAAANQGE